MPQRRGLSAGISGAFSGLEGAGNIFLRKALGDEAAKRQDLLERGRKADEMETTGQWTHEQAMAYRTGQPVAPSVQQELANIVTPMTKASTFQEVPGETALAGQFKARRLPLTGFGEMTTPSPDTGYPTNIGQVDTGANLPSRQYGDVSSPEFSQVLGARAEKLASFPPEKITDIDPEDKFGTKRTRYVPSNPATLTGSVFQAEPTPNQAGAAKQRELLGGELSEPVLQAKARGSALTSTATTRAQLQEEMRVNGLTTQQQAGGMGLANDFNQQSAPFFIRQEQMRTMSDLAQNPSAMKDLSMIYSFVTMNDPRTGVKGAEQAMVQGTAPIDERFYAYFNKLKTGETLTDNERKDLLSSAATIYRSSASEHQQRVQDFSQRAAQIRVPPNFVIRRVAPDTSDLQAPGVSPLDRVRARQPGG